MWGSHPPLEVGKGPGEQFEAELGSLRDDRSDSYFTGGGEWRGAGAGEKGDLPAGSALLGPISEAGPGRGWGRRWIRGAQGGAESTGGAATPPAPNGVAAAGEPTARFYSLSSRNKKVAIY